MVRQAAERLGTYTVGRALMDQLAHLAGKEPPLTGLVAKRYNRFSIFSQILNHGLLTEVLAGS